MEILRDVILDANVLRVVNVVSSIIGMLVMLWIVARWRPLPGKD
jgi:hypothetical protein